MTCACPEILEHRKLNSITQSQTSRLLLVCMLNTGPNPIQVACQAFVLLQSTETELTYKMTNKKEVWQINIEQVEIHTTVHNLFMLFPS